MLGRGVGGNGGVRVHAEGEIEGATRYFGRFCRDAFSSLRLSGPSISPAATSRFVRCRLSRMASTQG